MLSPNFSYMIQGCPLIFPKLQTQGNPSSFLSLRSFIIANSLSFISTSALILTTTSFLLVLSTARYTFPKPPYEIFFFILYLSSRIMMSGASFSSSSWGRILILSRLRPRFDFLLIIFYFSDRFFCFWGCFSSSFGCFDSSLSL